MSMKKKYLAIGIGIMLAIVTLTGCNKENPASESESTISSEISGEVQEIGADSITIKPDSTESTKEIKITENTTIKRQGMGNPTDMSGDNSEALEPPQGDRDNNAPEPPKNNGDNGNTPPELPEGNNGNNTPPEMPQNNNDGSAPPELPQGDNESNQPGDEPPAQQPGQPNGEAPNQQPTQPNGEAPNQQQPGQPSEELTLSDISVGDTVSINLNADGTAAEITITSGQMTPGNAAGGGPDGAPGGMGQASAPDSYQAVKEYSSDTDADDEIIASTGTNENAIHILNGANVNLSNFTVSRESFESTGGDASSFYGIGAAILTTDGNTSVNDSTITTNAAGGAGVFAYGDGTFHVSNTKIKTTQGTSGGIHVAGGGTLYAENLDVETNGESSAAIRSDRGGGTIVVDGGSYTSNGVGSPAIYSTADITVSNADLTATASEAICIEGLNSIRLTNSNLTGNMGNDSQNDCTWNVILYQSMSGDSEIGNSTFEMTDGTLTAKNGGMFYTTNTESTFALSNVDITYADTSEFFLRCTGNNNQRGWGMSGQNGANCTFTASNQEMIGDVIWDSISTLDFYMKEGSSLKGAVSQDETFAGNGGDGHCNLYIAKGCTWTVTGDSMLSALSCQGKITDENGNAVTIKGTDGTTYVKGNSNYTVTIASYEQ